MAKKPKTKTQITSEKDAIDAIRKKYGDGALMEGSGIIKDVEAISTGSLSLDIATGVGGFPRGRISEIFGAEAAGKTTLALEAICSAQKNGGKAVFVDVEHALDLTYAKNLGVNIDEIMISQPDSGEEAIEIAELLCKGNAVDIVVVDSVAALVPQAELDGDVGDTHIAGVARLMSQSMRRIKGIVNQSNVALVFINQLREKAGMSFGNPEVTTGGRALKFYASLRIDLRRISALKEKDDNYGNIVRGTCVKNKVAPPFRKGEFEIHYGKGISRVADLINIGIDEGIINKNGSWFSYEDVRLGQGKPAAIAFLEEDKDKAQEIEEMIIDLKCPWLRRKDGDSAQVEH